MLSADARDPRPTIACPSCHTAVPNPFAVTAAPAGSGASSPSSRPLELHTQVVERRHFLPLLSAIIIAVLVFAVSAVLLWKPWQRDFGSRAGADATAAQEEASWETEHHPEIVRLKSEGEKLAIDGKLAEAHEKYRAIMLLVGGRHVKDPLLFDEVEQAKTDQDRIYTLLMQQMQRQTVPPLPGALIPGSGTALNAAPQGGATTESSSVPPSDLPATSGGYPSMYDGVRAVAGNPTTQPPPANEPQTAAGAGVAAPPSTAPFVPVVAAPAVVHRELPVNGVTDAQIGQSLQRATEFLLSNYDAQKFTLRPQEGDFTDAERNGLNALVVYALLQAGQATHDDRLNIKSPFMKSVVERMKHDVMDTDAMTQAPVVYARSLRTAALAVYNRPEDRAMMKEDVNYLLHVCVDGAYTYDDRFSNPAKQKLQQQQEQQQQQQAPPPQQQQQQQQPQSSATPRYDEPAAAAWPNADDTGATILFHGRHNPDGSEMAPGAFPPRPVGGAMGPRGATPGALQPPDTRRPGGARPGVGTGMPGGGQWFPRDPADIGRGTTRPSTQPNYVGFPWDNSNSQYGLLGVWSGAELGIEVPRDYWKAIEKHWISCQLADGQWGYSMFEAQPRFGMTCAGVASLFITHDWLDASTYSQIRAGREPFSPALAKGLKFLETGDNGIDVLNSTTYYLGYNLYGLERVGLASGFKYLGRHDWYRELAAKSIPTQWPNGAFGRSPDGADTIADTAFAVLFLSRGRHPIFMNKLRFERYWSNRPREIANLARFASHELERPLNWQVVTLERDWNDWMDSPVLFIASNEALPTTWAQDIEKLKGYVNAGGMLFTHADAGSKPFSDSIDALARRLFPEYEMKDIPPDDPLFTVQYKIKQPATIKLRGVHNGVRWLLVHSPTDISLHWQTRNEKIERRLFELGVNVFVYAAGVTDLRNRLESPFVPPPEDPPVFTRRIARVKYAGNWDPEPYAWTRFARLFQWQTGQALDAVPAGVDQLKPEVFPLAHVTGTSPGAPSDTDLAALRAYVDGGGVLLIDPCGGAPKFVQSLQQDWLPKLIGDAKLDDVAPNDPLLAGGPEGTDKIAKLLLRPGTADRNMPAGTKVLAATIGKGRVIFSPVDLTAGLLGTNSLAITGYQSAIAQSLVKNAILEAIVPTAEPPATQPTTQPAP